jgi:hypothetical protein
LGIHLVSNFRIGIEGRFFHTLRKATREDPLRGSLFSRSAYALWMEPV